MLDMLFRVTTNLPIKIFVTSQPKPDIQLRVEAQLDERHSVCLLHDIKKSLVQADIKLYLLEQLANSAVPKSDLTQLASLSGSLFIYAATAVWYICRKGNIVDQAQLKVVLRPSSRLSYWHADIDRLYSTILDAAVYNPDQEPEEQEQMLTLLWTAVCTQESVSIDTLAALAVIEVSKAMVLLQLLYSVLHVLHGTNMVSMLHALFPDFIFDKAWLARFCPRRL
ncbi:peptidase C14 [Rhizoctonia solani]|uniref:Peptidase C14 n=1 Tax=Rhizoctonia solani TaxID=456999 RepID=A0A8H8T0H0_9AGAM|nr:peptidase C14 [Rhizoctonia solani]QRW23667.1 peptidase C14 [Rhizoctonia solani]